MDERAARRKEIVGMGTRIETQPASQTGFSLIEVMIAILLLTVGMLSLAQMMVVAAEKNSLSGHMTSSSALAKEQLELLKVSPFYNDVNTLTVNPVFSPGGDLNNNDTGYFQFYDAEGLPVTNANQAQFLVRWRVEQIVPPGGMAGLPMSMVRITVRCLASNTGGGLFERVGDTTYSTFRTANVS